MAGAIGMVSSLLGIDGGLGVVLAGVVVDDLSYHWLFWIPLVAIVLSAALTWRYIPESPVRAPGRITWTGAVLLSVGLSLLLLGVSQASTWGRGSPRTLATIVVAVLVLGAWVRNETRTDEPLVAMRMMRIRGVRTTNVAALVVGVASTPRSS